MTIDRRIFLLRSSCSLLGLLAACGGGSSDGGGVIVVPEPTPSPTPIPSPSPSPAPAPTPTATEWACIGDSMTSGVFSPSQAIPYFLERETGLEFANLGVIAQTSTEIIARVGATATIVSVEGDMIPANGAVTLTALDPLVINHTGPDLAIGVTAYQRALLGTLAGVSGILSRAERDGQPNDQVPISAFAFARLDAGEATACPPQSHFVPANDAAYRGRALVVRMGYNNRGQLDRIIADHRRLFSWNTRPIRRVLLLDPPIAYYATATDMTQCLELRDALRIEATAQGCAFFSIHAFIASEEGLVAAGITPNADDRAAIADGRTPLSATTGDGLHYTVAMNRAVAIRLATELRTLGYIAAA